MYVMYCGMYVLLWRTVASIPGGWHEINVYPIRRHGYFGGVDVSMVDSETIDLAIAN